MYDNERSRNELEMRVSASEERLRLAEAASGIATFELNFEAGVWDWSPQATVLFGRNPLPEEDLSTTWEQVVFVDDVPKIHAAVHAARQTGSFYVEFRVRHPDGGLHWIAGKGQVSAGPSSHAHSLRGAVYDITDRKALEARLLALNETLEARVAEVREEARILEVVNQTGVAVAGAFFYNPSRDEKPTRFTRCLACPASPSPSSPCHATPPSSNRRFAGKVRFAPTTF